MWVANWTALIEQSLELYKQTPTLFTVTSETNQYGSVLIQVHIVKICRKTLMNIKLVHPNDTWSLLLLIMSSKSSNTNRFLCSQLFIVIFIVLSIALENLLSICSCIARINIYFIDSCLITSQGSMGTVDRGVSCGVVISCRVTKLEYPVRDPRQVITFLQLFLSYWPWR